MECTIVGRFLYSARKAKGISQEDLSYGVCNRTTLSRIENGSILPGLKQIEVFFTRLGYRVPDNIVALTKADKKRCDLENTLNLLSDLRDPRREDLLREYKNCHPSWGKLENQFYLLQKGAFVSQYDERLLESIGIFEEALRLTIPDFSVEEEIPNHLLSIKEIALINAIAHSEYYLFEFDKKYVRLKTRAISRMRFLKQYFEQHFDDFESWSLYSLILFNLTNWVGLDGGIIEAKYLSERALQVEKSSLTYFILHLYNYGYTLASQKKYSEAKRVLRHYLHLYPLIDSHNDIEKDVIDLNQKFGFDFAL